MYQNKLSDSNKGENKRENIFKETILKFKSEIFSFHYSSSISSNPTLSNINFNFEKYR